MKEKQQLISFIRNVASNDFKKAHDNLVAVVNEKIKTRIQAAYSTLKGK